MIVLEFAGDRMLAIHAMPLRSAFHDLLREERGEHG